MLASSPRTAQPRVERTGARNGCRARGTEVTDGILAKEPHGHPEQPVDDRGLQHPVKPFSSRSIAMPCIKRKAVETTVTTPSATAQITSWLISARGMTESISTFVTSGAAMPRQPMPSAASVIRSKSALTIVDANRSRSRPRSARDGSVR